MIHNTTLSAQGSQVKVRVAEYPDTCPLCGKGINVDFQYGYRFENGISAELIFQCPRDACKHLFIGYYSQTIIPGISDDIFYLKKYRTYKISGP